MARKKAKSKRTVLRELAIDSGWHMMSCSGVGPCNCSTEMLAFLRREGLATGRLAVGKPVVVRR